MLSVKVFLLVLITFSNYCGTYCNKQQEKDPVQEILSLKDSHKAEFYSTNDIVDVFEEKAAKKSVLRVTAVNETVIALSLYKNKSLGSEYSGGFPVQIKAQFKEDDHELDNIEYLNFTFSSSSTEEIIYLPMNLTNINWLLVKADGPPINVLYDPKLLIKISKQLQQNHTQFSFEERENLVQNYVDFSVLVNRDETFVDGFQGFMELTRYMGHESNISVLGNIHIPLFEKTKYLMQANDELVGYVQNYFVPLVVSIMENADITDKYSKIIEWGLALQAPKYVDYASNLMDVWVDVPIRPRPRPSKTRVSLASWKCAAIAGDDENWNYLADLVSNNDNDTNVYLTDENIDVLQCTRNPHLYRKSLELVTDTGKGTLEATTPVWEEFKLPILTDFVIEKFEENSESKSSSGLELSSDPLVVGLLVQDLIRLHKTKKVETLENLLKIDKFMVKHQRRLGEFVVSNLRKQLRSTLGCLRSKENVICGGFGWNRFDQLYFSWLQENSMFMNDTAMI